jgi:ribokinase
MPSPLVRVAGNAVLDVLVRDVREPHGPALDGWGRNVQILTRPVEMVLGGCGAAPAYLLARLGVRVALHSNLGADPAGDLLGGWLAQAGVALDGERAAATAVHVVLLGPEGGRRSAYYTGDKVVWERCLEGEAPAWLLVSGYGKVDAGDLEALSRVFAATRRRGGRVAFDPSPWFAGRVTAAAMRAAWAEVDCLLGTEEELVAWHPASDPLALARGLLDLGPEVAVVKRGGRGAVYASRDQNSGSLPTEALAGVNTVGAGDTFNGRLVAGLCRGELLADAVRASMALATEVVRKGRGVLGAGV